MDTSRPSLSLSVPMKREHIVCLSVRPSFRPRAYLICTGALDQILKSKARAAIYYTRPLSSLLRP
jgi:hypothetical protein